jgi:4-amino-4-deoxy-L-arabinose transferase-like glycosyltransferase
MSKELRESWVKLRLPLAQTTRDAMTLTIIALASRLVCIWKAPEVASSSDSRLYLTLAKNLAFHHVFSMDQGAGALPPTALRPPLYPALIAALWWGEAAPVNATLALQAGFGAAIVTLVYLTARDQFGRTTAILAAAGMILARMSCIYTGLILTETLFTFLIALGVFLWGRQRPIPAGVAFGLAALTRTTIVPFLPVLFLMPLLPKWRGRWREYVLIGVASLAVTSIWVARNGVVFGRFIPVQESGFGQNLLFGTFETRPLWGQIWNGREWTGDQDAHPLVSAGEGLDGMQRERFRTRLALGRITGDPLRWLAARAQQYPRLFMDDSVIYQNEPTLLVVKGILFHLLNFVIVALAAFGVFIERGRLVALSHITLFPAFMLLIHLPLWVEPRYGLPMMPMVATLAAVGSLRLLERLRARVIA